MSQTAAAPDIAADAQASARRAASLAGVDIRELSDLADMQGASELFDAVWTDPTQTLMPVNLVRALSSAGAYVAGAFADRRMVGAIIGFVGLHHRTVVVHSHILGVRAETRGRSVGFALKQHQRAWCLQRGIDTVAWTFDPLVRRNAYFNLCKLGAVGSRYEPNFYGPMDDGINAGDETDRLVVLWRLDDDRVLAAAEGRAPAPVDLTPGAVLLDEDDQGRPRMLPADAAALRCRIPSDILQVRQRDARLALQWRHALRDTLGAAVRDGYTATGMDRAGWYTLTRSGGG
jgi:predicted GNAT superfamily acetyltransferase